MARNKDFDSEYVLERAMDLFWIKGYNATSIQDLVTHLGISRSSLYESFGDKKDLYKSVLNRYREKRSQELIDALTNSNSIYDTIDELFKKILKNAISDENHHGCFVINALTEFGNSNPEISAILAEHTEILENTITRALKKGQENGQISDKQSAKALARFFMNSVTGLRVSSRNVVNKKIFQDTIDVILSVFKV